MINEQLENLQMTKYRLSKESGVPQATINDICSGKADIEKCAVGTIYKIARVLGISIESILESANENVRSSFEIFKSNTCHYVKDLGDLDFILKILESDEIRRLYNKRWYPEALYLLAMKLMAGRQYKYDLSDVIGILWEHEKSGSPISLQQVKSAAENLYGSYEKIPENSRLFIERAVSEREYGKMYQRVRQMETENKDIRLQFLDNYPGEANPDNVNDIIAAIRKKKYSENES